MANDVVALEASTITGKEMRTLKRKLLQHRDTSFNIVAEMPTKQNERPTTALGRAIRKKRGDTPLRDVADQIGVHFTSLSRAETGAIPMPPLFIKLMLWLGVIDEKTAAKLNRYADETRG